MGIAAFTSGLFANAVKPIIAKNAVVTKFLKVESAGLIGLIYLISTSETYRIGLCSVNHAIEL